MSKITEVTEVPEVTEAVETAIEAVVPKELNVTAIALSVGAVVTGVLLAKGVIYLVNRRKNKDVVEVDTTDEV